MMPWKPRLCLPPLVCASSRGGKRERARSESERFPAQVAPPVGASPRAVLARQRASSTSARAARCCSLLFRNFEELIPSRTPSSFAWIATSSCNAALFSPFSPATLRLERPTASQPHAAFPPDARPTCHARPAAPPRARAPRRRDQPPREQHSAPRAEQRRARGVRAGRGRRRRRGARRRDAARVRGLGQGERGDHCPAAGAHRHDPPRPRGAGRRRRAQPALCRRRRRGGSAGECGCAGVAAEQGAGTRSARGGAGRGHGRRSCVDDDDGSSSTVTDRRGQRRVGRRRKRRGRRRRNVPLSLPSLAPSFSLVQLVHAAPPFQLVLHPLCCLSAHPRLAAKDAHRLPLGRARHALEPEPAPHEHELLLRLAPQRLDLLLLLDRLAALAVCAPCATSPAPPLLAVPLALERSLEQAHPPVQFPLQPPVERALPPPLALEHARDARDLAQLARPLEDVALGLLLGGGRRLGAARGGRRRFGAVRVLDGEGEREGVRGDALRPEVEEEAGVLVLLDVALARRGGGVVGGGRVRRRVEAGQLDGAHVPELVHGERGRDGGVQVERDGPGADDALGRVDDGGERARRVQAEERVEDLELVARLEDAAALLDERVPGVLCEGGVRAGERESAACAGEMEGARGRTWDRRVDAPDAHKVELAVEERQAGEQVALDERDPAPHRLGQHRERHQARREVEPDEARVLPDRARRARRRAQRGRADAPVLGGALVPKPLRRLVPPERVPDAPPEPAFDPRRVEPVVRSSEALPLVGWVERAGRTLQKGG